MRDEKLEAAVEKARALKASMTDDERVAEQDARYRGKGIDPARRDRA